MLDLENTHHATKINAAITQAIPDGIIVLDQERIVRHHNAHALNLFEVKSLPILGTAITQAIPTLADALNEILLNQGQPQPLSLRKGERTLSIKSSTINDEQNLLIIFIQDNSHTQIQAQQTKLAALGQLTANIAHEIRNPLSAISHACQLLEEDLSSDKNSQRTFQIISKNVQRIDQMMKEVLELNQRDLTKIVSIHLGVFLKEFHEYFCQIEKIPSHYFHLNLSKELIDIQFNPMHLDQVLWNLCRNGWRHSNKQAGSLSLATKVSQDGRHALLEIIDDGAGISTENRSRLFEPFFTTESGGTGLGLYVSRELCLNNRADIHYEHGTAGSKFSIKMQKVAIS